MNMESGELKKPRGPRSLAASLDGVGIDRVSIPMSDSAAGWLSETAIGCCDGRRNVSGR